jgi:hypothetical protein
MCQGWIAFPPLVSEVYYYLFVNKRVKFGSAIYCISVAQLSLYTKIGGKYWKIIPVSRFLKYSNFRRRKMF